MSLSRKITSVLLISSLALPSISTNLASASSLEPVTESSVDFTKLDQVNQEALAKKILNEGVVVEENSTIEIPAGFGIHNLDFDKAGQIGTFVLDPGPNNGYYDGYYHSDYTVPKWMIAMGSGAITGGIASAIKWPAYAVGSLTGGIGAALDVKISVKATTYYKLLSATSAEYYSLATVYLNDEIFSSGSHKWTAKIDDNID